MSKAIQFKNFNNEKIYPCPYFPIGYIYLSTCLINPESIFGGKWKQINDKFLLTSGNKYKAGNTGGEENHILKTEEMPVHNHYFTTTTAGYHEHQIALNGDSNFNIFYRLNWGNNHNGYCITGTNINGTSTYASYPSIAKGNGNHSHSGNTVNVGGSKAHNNMPPYLVVYAWERIS